MMNDQLYAEEFHQVVFDSRRTLGPLVKTAQEDVLSWWMEKVYVMKEGRRREGVGGGRRRERGPT